MTDSTVDVKAFKAETKRLGDRSRRLDKSQAKAKAELRFDLVQNVYQGVITGAIKDGYAKQEDYAKVLNVSPGSIRGLARLGKAIDLGCTMDDEHWSLLSSKVGTDEAKAVLEGSTDSKGLTTDKAKATRPAPEDIYAALTAVYDSQGRRITGGTGQGSDENNGSGDDSKSPDMERFGKALDTVRKVIGSDKRTAAEFKVIVGALENVLVEVREAAKPKATPETPVTKATA